MCDPVSMLTLASTTQKVMAGLSIASSAASAIGGASARSAQASALNEQRQNQSEEINAANGLKMGERVKQARSERARLRVAAGESGVTGQSFEAQLADSAFQESQDLSTIALDNRFAQRGSEARFQSALAANKGPGALGTGLQIVRAGVAGYKAGTPRPTK